MIRVATMLLFGLLFWMAFDFIFYAGLMVNYIKAYNIPIFFNEFFIDSQIWWVWIPAVLLYGAVFMVKNRKTKKAIFYLLSVAIASLTWIPNFGEEIGRALFAKENMSYQFNHTKIDGVTLLYSGRGYDYVLLKNRKIAVKYHTSYRVAE
ncbi:MAG: hypothetical protein L3J42_06015 [Hydrogenimonas sp.]|nr:hypothetical protein [Hydrogenimonas sp.]